MTTPTPTESTAMTATPTILFVCVHNAGRSQIAAGYAQALGGDRVQVLSAGSAPKDQINPVRDRSDGGGRHRHRLEPAEDPHHRRRPRVRRGHHEGCGDACPIFPGKRYEDWNLTDPAGKGIDDVRLIRDEIKTRVQALLAELLPTEASA